MRIAVGLYEFLFVFFPEQECYPAVIRLSNLMQSVPNDDDIQSTYASQRQDFRTNYEAKRVARLRKAKLNLVLGALWSGRVTLRGMSIGSSRSELLWVPVFLVVQVSVEFLCRCCMTITLLIDNNVFHRDTA